MPDNSDPPKHIGDSDDSLSALERVEPTSKTKAKNRHQWMLPFADCVADLPQVSGEALGPS